MAFKASVTALEDLIEEYLMTAYGCQERPGEGSEDISGVTVIPKRGTVSQGSVTIKDERVYKMMERLDADIWILVVKYQQRLRRLNSE
jgi:hypothetical protein